MTRIWMIYKCCGGLMILVVFLEVLGRIACGKNDASL